MTVQDQITAVFGAVGAHSKSDEEMGMALMENREAMRMALRASSIPVGVDPMRHIAAEMLAAMALGVHLGRALAEAEINAPYAGVMQ